MTSDDWNNGLTSGGSFWVFRFYQNFPSSQAYRAQSRLFYIEHLFSVYLFSSVLYSVESVLLMRRMTAFFPILSYSIRFVLSDATFHVPQLFAPERINLLFLFLLPISIASCTLFFLSNRNGQQKYCHFEPFLFPLYQATALQPYHLLCRWATVLFQSSNYASQYETLFSW